MALNTFNCLLSYLLSIAGGDEVLLLHYIGVKWTDEKVEGVCASSLCENRMKFLQIRKNRNGNIHKLSFDYMAFLI